MKDSRMKLWGQPIIHEDFFFFWKYLYANHWNLYMIFLCLQYDTPPPLVTNHAVTHNEADFQSQAKARSTTNVQNYISY